MAVLGDPIVRLDLRGMGVRLQAERDDEARAEFRPVELRQSRDVRIEVAHRAVHLAEQLHARDAFALPLEASGDIGELLADGGGRRRLSVRAREHARIGVAQRERVDPLAERGEHGHEHGAARTLQHEGVGEVVDVLRGRGEMHPLELSGGRAARLELGADPVFDRLTSCLVRDSMRLTASTSVALGSCAKRRAQSRALAGSDASAAAAGPSARASSHAHSTRTRSRTSPASQNISRTALSFAA